MECIFLVPFEPSLNLKSLPDKQTARAFLVIMPSVSTCVLVVDTDFKDITMREALKKIGGVWAKGFGWVLPEASRAAASKIVAGEALTLADLTNVVDPTADPPPSVDASASIDVSDYVKKGAKKGSKPRSALATGDTMLCKAQLTAMGGKFNFPLKGYIFPLARKEQIVRVLQLDTTNTITVDEGGQKNSSDDDDNDSFIATSSDEEKPRKKKKKKKISSVKREITSEDDDNLPIDD